MKEEGTTSKAPIRESFGRWSNLRLVLIALFGAVVGQAVVWYTGQFYALFFLEKTLKVDGATANILIAVALAIGTPFFVLFGWLSDRIGRKPIILSGCAIAAVAYFPIFVALTEAANPALAAAQRTAPVTVVADPDQCSFQFDPIGKNRFDRTSCDIAKSYLAKQGIGYDTIDAAPGTTAVVRVGDKRIPAYDPRTRPANDAAVNLVEIANFQDAVKAALCEAGYPARADPAAIDRTMVVLLLSILMILVTMVYGPIAALLVELFPTRIRYTSMSLPYHIGNGWFGGFLPATAFAMVAATGDIYYGLWYPVIAAALTLVVGLVLLPETFRRRIDD